MSPAGLGLRVTVDGMNPAPLSLSNHRRSLLKALLVSLFIALTAALGVVLGPEAANAEGDDSCQASSAAIVDCVPTPCSSNPTLPASSPDCAPDGCATADPPADGCGPDCSTTDTATAGCEPDDGCSGVDSGAGSDGCVSDPCETGTSTVGGCDACDTGAESEGCADGSSTDVDGQGAPGSAPGTDDVAVAAPVTEVTGTRLPLTGADSARLAAIGLALVSIGILMRTSDRRAPAR